MLEHSAIDPLQAPAKRPPTPDPVREPAEAPTRLYQLPRGRIERLGEWLVRRGLLGRVELFLALDASYRHGCRIGDAVVWLDYLTRTRVEREAASFERFAGRQGLTAG